MILVKYQIFAVSSFLNVQICKFLCPCMTELNLRNFEFWTVCLAILGHKFGLWKVVIIFHNFLTFVDEQIIISRLIDKLKKLSCSPNIHIRIIQTYKYI